MAAWNHCPKCHEPGAFSGPEVRPCWKCERNEKIDALHAIEDALRAAERNLPNLAGCKALLEAEDDERLAAHLYGTAMEISHASQALRRLGALISEGK